MLVSFAFFILQEFADIWSDIESVVSMQIPGGVVTTDYRCSNEYRMMLINAGLQRLQKLFVHMFHFIQSIVTADVCT